MNSLFDRYSLAGMPLANRAVMAPMTRARATESVADSLTARYYTQRAGAGLIISEGAQISEQARGYLCTPGIHSEAQVKGWQTVTSQVHAAGGRIFLQLWHVGRLSHVSLQTLAGAPVSSVDRHASQTLVFALDADGHPGKVAASPARGMTVEEIRDTIEDFAIAAENAIRAGFDGVELHAAGGFLFEQFMNAGLNVRNDLYGGSRSNRLRMLLQTLDTVSARIGAERVSVRIAPGEYQGDLLPHDDDHATWRTLTHELNQRDLAYLHISSANTPQDWLDEICNDYDGTLILAGGFDQEGAEHALATGQADLIAFGTPFIANPDLVERMRRGWPLAWATREAFYGGGALGYTDYPNYRSQG
ncbi:alkene reductase [Pseudomonas ceruminis]|uniref:alkene reductase n=1 Tax=Pseudomonas putida group TaxID=136845 RepID=UPI003D06B617